MYSLATFIFQYKGAAMPKNTNVTNGLPWIDLFSGPGFTGKLHRLRPSKIGQPEIYEAGKLPKFGSLIVGPDVIADFKRVGKPKSIQLSPRTLLWDASGLVSEEFTLSLLPA
jgi:hypothetical protein